MEGVGGTLALMAGVSQALTDSPWPYLVRSRRPVNVSSPVAFMERKVSASGQSERVSMHSTSAEKAGHFLQRFDPRDVDLRSLADNAGYFLWGRHVGVLLYMPFTALCILFFLLHERRSLGRWLILAALIAYSLAFFLLLPFRWHGGGGFIGNRYAVIAYPALLFLVTRIRPSWWIAAGFALGGVFLGSILATPFGALVDQPTLQAHVRNAPFRHFPFELTLARRIPGYSGDYQSGVWFRGRADVFQVHGDELWFHGADSVEAWMITDRPLGDATFLVRSAAPQNSIEICLEREWETVAFAGAEGPDRQKVTVTAPKPWKKRLEWGSDVYTYRLSVTSATGEKPKWRGGGHEDFYQGAALLFLGSTDERDRDLYHVAWDVVDKVTRVEAGSRFQVRLILRNTSEETWPIRGATRVALSYHWADSEGRTTVRDGLRTDLSAEVPPGESVEVIQEILAPEAAGSQVLTLDLVREQVAWFSERNAEASVHWTVTVTDAE